MSRMNWAKVCCIFGVHSLTQWRSFKPKDDYQRRVLAAIRAVDGIPDGPVSKRHCRRKGCSYEEIRPARLRRTPMEADTVPGQRNG